MQGDSNDIVYDSYGVDFTPLFRSVYEFMTGSDVTTNGFFQLLQSLWTGFSVFAFLISFLFIFGIIYSYLKINEYAALSAAKLEAHEAAWQALYGQNAASGGSAWSTVEAHVASDSPSEWKLAIIEADIMLGKALTAAGYNGSIGEQLKSVPKTQLQSLQDAWDAHLIRNKIAHEGSDFVLTRSMAQEAIIKFGRVLRELQVIA